MTQIFDSPPGYAFESTIQALAPGARGTALLELFDGRLPKQRICDYRKGRRAPPLWVIELLRAKLQRRHEAELKATAQMKAGPGLKAGARNLAEYLARRR